MIQKDIRDDIKLTLFFANPLGDSKLEISLFSMVEKMVGNNKMVVKDKVWKATNAPEGDNIKMLADNKVLVTFDYNSTVTDPTKFDAGWFAEGKLYGTAYISRLDEDMPDGEISETIHLNIPVEIVNKDKYDKDYAKSGLITVTVQ